MSKKRKSLSDCLKKIGEERVDVIINGVMHSCSQTEATARKLYLLANGGTETVEVDGEMVTIRYKPNANAAKTLREFTEGKAAPEPPKESAPPLTPGTYDSEIGRRLNERFGQGAGESKPKKKRKKALE